MKTKILITVSLLFTICICNSFSQKIEKDELDDFTGKRYVVTNWEKAIGSMNKNPLAISFRLENNNELLQLKWQCSEVLSVSKDAELMMKLSNDEIITLKNTEYQIASKGAGTVGFTGSGVNGLSLNYYGNFTLLKDALISKIRIYTTDGYKDLEIGEKAAKKIQKQYQLFSKTIHE